MKTQVFVNGQFVSWDNATLHVSDLSIQRGYGIFDFFRVRDNVLLFVQDHLDRYEHSAQIMGLDPPFARQEMIGFLKEMVRRNNLPQSGIKIILTGGYSPDSYAPTKPNLIIIQSELSINDSFDPKPIRIITHEFARDISDAKTINYSTGIWLQKKVMEHQAADALYHTNGLVTEFPRSNLFIVDKDGAVVTPAQNILKGVTRKRILELASTEFSIREGQVTIDDMLGAREAFLTSSTKRIQSIVQVDSQMVGDGRPGKVTTTLLKLLVEAERSFVEKELMAAAH